MNLSACEFVTGVCCARLVQPKCLMKIGLCMVLVGHVNFLLGGLVHGTVLRDVSLGIHMLEYAISNILALTAGLVVRRARITSSFILSNPMLMLSHTNIVIDCNALHYIKDTLLVSLGTMRGKKYSDIFVLFFINILNVNIYFRFTHVPFAYR